MCLAKKPSGIEEFVRVDVLSRESGVPAPYLSKIIGILAQKNIVETRRGLTGGVRLRSDARKISFFDVCVALDESIIQEQCLLSRKACDASSPCPLHDEWKHTRERIHKFLKKVKIVPHKKSVRRSGTE